jgi:hypothetical protein
MMGLFVLGHISTVAKDVSKGRDPVPLFNDDRSINWEQAIRALMQGGGLGLYGDLILNDQTRFGSGWGETLVGPTPGLYSDIVGIGQQVLKANFEDEWDDMEKEKRDRMIGEFIKLYMPTAWQARAFMERGMNKAIDAAIDPNWDRKMRRAEKRREKEYGQEQFWAEDEWLPDRAPEYRQAPAD